MGGEGFLVMGTNRVEKGLTQTQKDPSIQGQLQLALGQQISLSLWGANAFFSDDSNHVHLRGQLNLIYEMNPQVVFNLNFGANQFSKARSRNGNYGTLGVKAYGVIGQITRDSNFEGTQSASNHYLVGYTWPLNPSWHWKNTLGLNDMTASGYRDYVDYESVLDFLFGNKSVSLGVTMATLDSQFESRAKPNFYLQFTTRF
jgi:hypothetical protein